MPEASLHARDVGVVRAGRRIVQDVSVDVSAGHVQTIIGPNGAGKSTLVRALAGLVPYSGTVTIEGHDMAKLTPRARARLVSFVPQRSELAAPLPVRTVVAHGRFAAGSSAPDRVARAMDRTRVAHLAERPFTQLSEGERRRVLIARALAGDARVMLLDEPTAALDVRHALELLELVRALAAEGRAIVLVLHSLDEARRIADDVLLLHEGVAAAQGPASQVIATDPVRQVYDVELVERGALGARLRGTP